MLPFHSLVAAWFERRFAAPTPAQAAAWPAIASGRDVLVAAPTGSGKTLCAFLSAIDQLAREAATTGLPSETRVLYVSPLKALSVDIELNLARPLAEIGALFGAEGQGPVEITTAVRTGDTSARDRTRTTARPPHVFVTTPESLYVLLTSEGGRAQLRTVRTIIVDEIHALVSDKRGAHLALSLERLDALVTGGGGARPQRIGLSATQKPIEEVARFLVGAGRELPVVVDEGHQRPLDLSLWVPGAPLEAVLSSDSWLEIYDELARLIGEHKTTLVFTNTRRMAERITRFLAERLGEDAVTSHHGSLSRELRHDAEQRLKSGKLRALVATASLELGIDVGDVDLVCQIGSPKRIATLLQRVGRSGHHVGGTPKGRIFPTTRDDLVECVALVDCVRRGELDRVTVPSGPLDILAQQVVASLVPEDLLADDLYERVRRAHPYRDLSRDAFDGVVRMLRDGFSTERGRRAAFVHEDTTTGRLHARRGARLAAMQNGGAIPDTFDYEVLLQPSDTRVGSVHEDFAIESSQGDIFQLGNTSYQILKVDPGVLRVADAKGQPPTIPFWIGEAPGRSRELSEAVSRLRQLVVDRAISEGDRGSACEEGAARGGSVGAGPSKEFARTWANELGVPAAATEQVVDYLLATKVALGLIPTQSQLVVERFFDLQGGMHLVFHAPYGVRFNRAFGLALRKRFCRSFNVELQAAAGEDALVLSLGPTHSFPLEEVFSFLGARSARDVLVQALLDAPLFQTRFRWNASRSLSILRRRGARKVPPRFQRMDADDLLALCFPDQVACLENIAGDREIPNHPLVTQTIEDSLHEAMDVELLLDVLARIEAGSLTCHARDVTEPSPLAHEILTARPYAFLDDAPLEERRTQAVLLRRFSSAESASDLGRLDPEAIERVVEESWPDPRDPDELHDALGVYVALTECEGLELEARAGRELFASLLAAGRAERIETEGGALWTAREHAPLVAARAVDDDALVEVVRGRLELLGPTTEGEIARALGIEPSRARQGLLLLEARGFVLRGRYRPGAVDGGREEWCERRLLARIHRLTLARLRREIEPVSVATYVDFLGRFQSAAPGAERRGAQGTLAVIEQLAGYPVAARAWEESILPRRVRGFVSAELDQLCFDGLVTWRAVPRETSGPIATTPVWLLPRDADEPWITLRSRLDRQPTGELGRGLYVRGSTVNQPTNSAAVGDAAAVLGGGALGADALRVRAALERGGATFFADLGRAAGLLPTQVEGALRELVARGLVTSDGFSGLRRLITPSSQQNRRPAHRRSVGAPPSLLGSGARREGPSGRFSLVRPGLVGADELLPSDVRPDELGERVERSDEERLIAVAWQLLRRWGIVLRRVLEREHDVPPWRQLVRVYHRLEARGEIRGGRFVSGLSGEQFALPEAVAELRRARREGPVAEPIVLSAVDPLNLAGILTPDARVTSAPQNRVVLWGGEYVASVEGRNWSVLSAGTERDLSPLAPLLRGIVVPGPVVGVVPGDSHL